MYASKVENHVIGMLICCMSYQFGSVRSNSSAIHIFVKLYDIITTSVQCAQDISLIFLCLRWNKNWQTVHRLKHRTTNKSHGLELRLKHKKRWLLMRQWRCFVQHIVFFLAWASIERLASDIDCCSFWIWFNCMRQNYAINSRTVWNIAIFEFFFYWRFHHEWCVCVCVCIVIYKLHFSTISTAETNQQPEEKIREDHWQMEQKILIASHTRKCLPHCSKRICLTSYYNLKCIQLRLTQFCILTNAHNFPWHLLFPVFT